LSENNEVKKKQSNNSDGFRSLLHCYNGGPVAGLIIFIIFLTGPIGNKPILFWILSVAWLIAMISFTIWRFTGLKKIYDLKFVNKDQKGIKIMLVLEIFAIMGFISWWLIWFGIYIGTALSTTLSIALMLPLMLSGFFLLLYTPLLRSKDLFE
jgi:hypothetical protein